jgi:hypothetical protein
MTCDGCRRLQGEVAELRGRMEAMERRQGPRDAADVALLAALARLERRFTTSAALRHAGLVDEALAAALQAADVSSAKELGWLLRRCIGRHGSFLVERLRDSRDGAWWRVSRH